MSEGTQDNGDQGASARGRRSVGGDDPAARIADKVASSKARNRKRAAAPPTAEGGYSPPDTRSLAERTVDDHPLALLAGSLVLGVVAANFVQASLIRRLGSRMLGAVVVAGELGAKAGNKTLGAAAEAGRAGQERLAKLGDLVAEEGAEVRRRAAELGSQAGRRAIDIASDAAAEAREKGAHALDRLGKIGGRR